jgi:hypothetical protein
MTTTVPSTTPRSNCLICCTANNQERVQKIDFASLGLQRPKHHTFVISVQPPVPPIIHQPGLQSSPFEEVSSIPDDKFSIHSAKDSPSIKSRAVVLYRHGHHQKCRAKRRTEVELLREDWSNLHFFKNRRYEPLIEEFGSTKSGEMRRSRRIYWRKLLKGS